MKTAAVRKLAQNHDLETLQKAEEALLNEEAPSIEVEGEDEGDKITNINGAIYVLEQTQKNGTDIKDEVRNFTQRVRDSIS